MSLNCDRILLLFLRQDEEAVIAGRGTGSQAVKAIRIFQGISKFIVLVLVLMGLFVYY